jgi:hypothetical protein
MEKKEGISFLVRIRDEEHVLERSIRSLFTLTIPYEIVLVLHLCTDKSSEIAQRLAEENPAIKIYTYDIEVSRAGYETLATDVNSPHSFVTYYNWCLAKTSYSWIFKWDADFLATPPLLNFLNTNTWTKQKIAYRISCRNADSNNVELYLMGSLKECAKYWFWEVPYFEESTQYINIDHSINIEHVSSLAVLKKYWNNLPWFETEQSEEAVIVKNRIDRLTQEYGIEPKGLARASNPECDRIMIALYNRRPDYVSFNT